MPSRKDFDAARDAAFNCLNASHWLLEVAGKPVPEAKKEAWIARHLDQLARALMGASDAISKVEHELTVSALSTGPVKAGGMTCATAHRLALDLAGYLGNTIGDIDRRLVPRKPCGPPRQSSVDVDLVRKHLPAIVAKLAARPPLDAQHVESLMAQESARAIDRLDSARVGPARPVDAPPPPPADQPSGTEATGPPKRIAYVVRDHEVAWFDPAPPTQFWPGLPQHCGRNDQNQRWNLFRTADDVWIVCYCLGYDGKGWNPWRWPGERSAYRRITAKQAEHWFIENRTDPPDVLFQDMEQERNRETNGTTTAGPPVGPADVAPAGPARPPSIRADGPAEGERPPADPSGTPREHRQAAGPPVILGKPGGEPIVNGKRKPRLTVPRYNIIKALLDAGDLGLTGDDLVRNSGHGGAVNTLKTLAKKDTDWGAVILLPGQPGGRYRILSQSDGD